MTAEPELIAALQRLDQLLGLLVFHARQAMRPDPPAVRELDAEFDGLRAALDRAALALRAAAEAPATTAPTSALAALHDHAATLTDPPPPPASSTPGPAGESG